MYIHLFIKLFTVTNEAERKSNKNLIYSWRTILNVYLFFINENHLLIALGHLRNPYILKLLIN